MVTEITVLVLVLAMNVGRYHSADRDVLGGGTPAAAHPLVSEAALADARRAVVVSDLARLLAELQVYFATGDLKSAVLKETTP